MKLEELNKLDIPERIKELKKFPAKRPETQRLLKDWDYSQHDVFNVEIRKKRKVLVKEPEENPDGTIKKPAVYEEQEVNRIALPLEQDIVNIHTAFTVGTEPSLTLQSEDEEETKFLSILKNIFAQNKIKYENKRIVRSWLSECEVAEYWYTVENASWWQRVLGKLNLSSLPTRKLKSVIWSPFRGDTLYPYYDEFGDMIAFSREYKSKDKQGNDVTKLVVIDNQNVTTYADEKQIEQFKHGFDKIPVIYMKREKPLCDRIRTKRNRLEVLLSNFADCLDYNFYPKLVATGDLEGVQNRGTTSEIINLKDGGQVAYLTWQQSPEMARLEFDNLINYCYSLTNTPRISFESLKGTGNALSGTAFRYVFMGMHLEVSNHAEVIEEFLQRRVNFLVSAIGSVFPKMKNTADTISIETEIVPYMIDSQSERITDAVNAVSGGVASLETGIVMAGITDRVQEEQEKIKNQTEKPLFDQ
ncbi:phage portal protein [Capnocytophaga sp.]|uniref:phage portal protein n=1 Tax=Capnocytophaga sp. TaxID=44737 RepID=UPI0026DAE11F|nr:phage portal protein [Capnocytophaga sp.]MDO5106035.1 phage portal protein [Capnocytophaga sp.]